MDQAVKSGESATKRNWHVVRLGLASRESDGEAAVANSRLGNYSDLRTSAATPNRLASRLQLCRASAADAH